MKRCLFFLLVSARVVLAQDTTPQLARDLLQEGDAAGAALEYRRLALGAEQAEAQAGWYWSAAYAHVRGGSWPEAERLLDRAEDRDPALGAAAALLRGESAFAKRDYDAAVFYFESATQGSTADADVRRYGERRMAAAHIQRGESAKARAALASPDQPGAAALRDYEAGRDRRPQLGGWLGLVPGLGYAYAGEYANATRSLILNSLFIWGMVSTAENEQWGGFAALTFFELTWYTGSIYGGVDASHRYNEARRSRAIEAITAGAMITPDFEALPAVKLKVAF